MVTKQKLIENKYKNNDALNLNLEDNEEEGGEYEIKEESDSEKKINLNFDDISKINYITFLTS